MGHSASTCGSQPHRLIYGAQRPHLWVSAPQADLWGTVGLLVGLSPTGRSMGHSGPTCGSQPHRPIYGAQRGPTCGSQPHRPIYGAQGGPTCGSQPHRPIYGAQRGPTCGSQPHRPRWRTGSSGAKPHTCGAELWGGGGSPGRPLQNGVPQHFGGAPRIPPHNPTGAPHHCGEAQPRKIHGDPTAS